MSLRVAASVLDGREKSRSRDPCQKNPGATATSYLYPAGWMCHWRLWAESTWHDFMPGLCLSTTCWRWAFWAAFRAWSLPSISLDVDRSVHHVLPRFDQATSMMARGVSWPQQASYCSVMSMFPVAALDLRERMHRLHASLQNALQGLGLQLVLGSNLSVLPTHLWRGAHDWF